MNRPQPAVPDSPQDSIEEHETENTTTALSRTPSRAKRRGVDNNLEPLELPKLEPGAVPGEGLLDPWCRNWLPFFKEG